MSSPLPETKQLHAAWQPFGALVHTDVAVPTAATATDRGAPKKEALRPVLLPVSGQVGQTAAPIPPTANPRHISSPHV